MTRFSLTGRVVVEGADVLDQSDLPGRQGRVALVRLVLERHRPLPAAELTSAIWGTAPPDSVQASLRALLSRLRGALDEAGTGVTIESDAGCYQVRCASAWVDVEEAANAIDRAEGAWRAHDEVAAWSDAAVACAIARRPLLPSEDAAWITEPRDRLVSVRVRALGVLAGVYTTRGDHALAIAAARESVALEPFRESGHRLLMQTLLASGDRAEALRAYEKCRVLLRDELGIEPSGQTRDLHLSALREH